MSTYIIRELQHPNDTRQGEVVEAVNLTAAKRRATKQQLFQGTVMTIEYANQIDGQRLAIKENGKWRDYL